jgi:nitrile hydratase alpha subunit
MNQEEQGKKISQLIAKCWADEGFKKKVLADPAKTLRAEGMELRDDLSYVAHENTDKVFHLVIPTKPTELSDEDLGHVAGGIVKGADAPLVISCSTCLGPGGGGGACCGW